MATGQRDAGARPWQPALRVDALGRVAFEPGHFAVLAGVEPGLELWRAGGRFRADEPAGVEAEFERAVSNGLLHRRADWGSLNPWVNPCAPFRLLPVPV